MAAWLSAFKSILPHLGTIVAAAGPVFSKRQSTSYQDALLQDQIAELQAAAAQSAKHIGELAGQMQSTVGALEHAAAQLESRLHTAKILSATAIGLSILALCVALAAIIVR
jgi:hypothetical protein